MPVPEAIELQPQQLGHDLDDRLLLAQLLHIDAEHRLVAAAQGRREALAVRIGRARLARHDEGDDPIAAAHLHEVPHFLVDPFRFRRGGRTDHDQVAGVVQFLAEVVQKRPGPDIGLVAKDGTELFRQVRGFLADDARKPVRFQAGLEPLGPGHVLVLVADEGEELVPLFGGRRGGRACSESMTVS